MIQNYLESVCADIRSCPAKFGTSGTSRTEVIGCIHAKNQIVPILYTTRFAATNLSVLAAAIFPIPGEL